MQLVRMNCSSCGAPLDVDLDNLQANCPHCGQRLMIDFDQLGKVLSEREKTKRDKEKEENQTKRAELEYEYKYKAAEKKHKKETLEVLSPVIGIIGFLLFCGLIIFVPLLPSSSEIRHNEHLEFLNQVEVELEEAMKTGDFDLALIKANQLYADNWSETETATMNERRENYVNLIETKKKEAELNDPDNIFMPTSSGKFEGKNMKEVEQQLKDLGFTNITVQVAAEEAGFFTDNEDVEHILIGGKTSFTKEDYFKKDTPIIIYYYSK